MCSTRICGRCRQARPAPYGSRPASPFEYFKDPDKTKEARSAGGTMSTVGDVGYVDEGGYVYLTDRRIFMIISGGVNVYPQECENLVITHPKVAELRCSACPMRISARR
jgi:long-chain acyl-CoA synthetase